MTDIATTVENYIAMWNETDAAERRALVARTLADDADYLDPLMSGAGSEQIDGMIAAVQEQYAEHRFTLVAGPDSHNDRVRFTWSLAPAGGDPIAYGIDFATLAADGRLQSVTGFLEIPQH